MRKGLVITFSVAVTGLCIVGCGKNTTTKSITKNTDKTMPIITTYSRESKPQIISYSEYFVSPTGDDSNDGRTAGKPISLKKALKTISSGDTINLLDGTYEIEDTLTISNSGSMLQRTTIMGYGNNVIFDFKELGDGIIIDASYVNLKNITINNSISYGLSIKGKGNLIENCICSYNCEGGLLIAGANASDNYISGCLSRYNALDGYTASGFYVSSTAGSGNIFESCVAYRNQNNGFDINSIKSVLIRNSLAMENGIYKDGTINNDAAGIKAGFMFNNKMHEISNSISYNNSKYGFRCDSKEDGGYKLTNCSSINNHYCNYFLPVSNGLTSNVNLTNVLSYNDLDLDDNNVLDAVNDRINCSITNSIFFIEKEYFYSKTANYDSLDLTVDLLNLDTFENEYKINTVIPEEMKIYDEEEVKQRQDECKISGDDFTYDGISYTIKFFKNAKIELNGFLDRCVLFQDELLDTDKPTYFGAKLENEK